MRTIALGIMIVCLTAIVTISVLNCATTPPPSPETVKKALKLADETCDVVVLLDDGAKSVCVPIGQVEAIARTVLKSEARPVEVPEGTPSIRVKRTTLLPVPHTNVRQTDDEQDVSPAPSVQPVEAGDQ